eukprot:s2072_g9.t1
MLLLFLVLLLVMLMLPLAFGCCFPGRTTLFGTQTFTAFASRVRIAEKLIGGRSLVEPKGHKRPGAGDVPVHCPTSHDRTQLPEVTALIVTISHIRSDVR